MKNNIIIAHGGGPTAVINASLYGAVTEARKHGCFGTVYGAIHGIEGVLNEQFIDLSKAEENQIQMLPYTPSSAIGSCRRKLTDEDYPVILEILDRHDIGYFIYNGGNDSMDTCHKMEQIAKKFNYPLQVAGIPKTIDNDLGYTDHCPGFGSAARFVTHFAHDLWMEVKALPVYVTIMETMGRNAGWLAATASLARINDEPCAKLIYLPEVPIDEDKFCADVENQLSRRKELLIVVSEGIVDKNGKVLADTGFVDGFGHSVPGGTAQALTKILLNKLGVKARAERPGLTGRALRVLQSDVDREEAIACGKRAVEMLVEGETGYMVTLERLSNDPYRFGLGKAPLEAVANLEKKFPLEWITQNGTGIAQEFIDYCKPLAGEMPPECTYFDTFVK